MAAIGAFVLLVPDRVEAQGGPVAGFNAGNGIANFDNSAAPHPNSNLYLPFEPLPPGVGPLPPGWVSRNGLWLQNLTFPITPLNQQPGCVRPDPMVPNRVICPGPPLLRGYKLVLGLPHRNWATVDPAVPKLPGPNVIKGGNKRDVINGGQSDEKIDTGKGKDKIDPGKGNDVVNAGKGNDEIDSQDGKVDRINGGKGKDVAMPDPEDKLKNVEAVKRK